MVGSLTRHLHENELADAGSGDELKWVTRGVEDLKNLAIVDTRLHETGSNVHEQSQASETRAPLWRSAKQVRCGGAKRNAVRRTEETAQVWGDLNILDCDTEARVARRKQISFAFLDDDNLSDILVVGGLSYSERRLAS